jgi:hypothetical protein
MNQQFYMPQMMPNNNNVIVNTNHQQVRVFVWFCEFIFVLFCIEFEFKKMSNLTKIKNW